MIHHGDCLDVMPTLDAASVDAVVTDPPYGLGFMGKAWDHAAGADQPMRRRPEVDAVNAGMSRQGGRQWAGLDGQRRQARDARTYQEWCERWAAEMLRVAKPSAYLLAFGGTRTVHRMACAIEDAGWIIRDMLVWGYASGFPKSKASLKPAWEPIVMARKPGPLRMLAIDECRIEGASDPAKWGGRQLTESATFERIGGDGQRSTQNLAGRWPANIILTDPIFDGDMPGVVGGGETSVAPPGAWTLEHQTNALFPKMAGTTVYGDSGTYSRFFLIPKAARSDREPVLGGLDKQWWHQSGAVTEAGQRDGIGLNRPKLRANVHPTVKPTDLMRHLVRLVTPPGGIVLDPFLGSGTTALAAEMEGFGWLGIEREAEYVAIAEARLNGTQKGMGLVG